MKRHGAFLMSDLLTDYILNEPTKEKMLIRLNKLRSTNSDMRSALFTGTEWDHHLWIMLREYSPIIDWSTDYIFNYVASEHIFIIQKGFNANILPPTMSYTYLGCSKHVINYESNIFFTLLRSPLDPINLFFGYSRLNIFFWSAAGI